MKCKKCEHWKNEQAEIEYREFVGICASPKLEFNAKTGCSAYVIDRSNPNTKKAGLHNFENKQGYLNVKRSNYCLVTSEEFGCVNFVKK